MITVTHPGKLGDLLWALPTVRELALSRNDTIQLWLPSQCKPLVNLLAKQWYIRQTVIDEDWVLGANTPEAPAKPPVEPDGEVIHLGYPEWPTMPLPFYTASLAGVEPSWDPWIEAEPLVETYGQQLLLYAWTDNWFELKLGLTEILIRQLPVNAWTLRTDPKSARWPIYEHAYGTKIEELARCIASSTLVVTDCSMAMVLTAALGKRCVVMEPEPARHHPIFWPGSTQDDSGHWRQADNQFGRLIWPVIGGDGKPTFDARHTKDLIMELLRA
jgi:hypothetical protein